MARVFRCCCVMLVWATILVVATGAANAQDPMDVLPPDPATSVVVNPARAEVGTGEPVTVTLSFPSGADMEEVTIEFPRDQRPQVFVGKPRREGPSRFTVEMRPLAQGELRLGPLSIRARPTGSQSFVEMTGNEFLLTVPALPASEVEDLDPAPFTAPLEVPFDYFWRNLAIGAAVLLFLFLLVLLGAAVAMLVRRRMAAAQVVPELPPVESALLAVRGLKSLDIYRQFGAERHYTMLSMAMRRYVQQQFGLRAVEMTEAEFEEALRHDLARVPRADSLIDATRRMSLAKFARQPVTEDVALADAQTAETFLLLEQQRLADAARAATARPGASGDSIPTDRAA